MRIEVALLDQSGWRQNVKVDVRYGPAMDWKIAYGPFGELAQSPTGTFEIIMDDEKPDWWALHFFDASDIYEPAFLLHGGPRQEWDVAQLTGVCQIVGSMNPADKVVGQWSRQLPTIKAKPTSKAEISERYRKLFERLRNSGWRRRRSRGRRRSGDNASPPQGDIPNS